MFPLIGVLVALPFVVLLALRLYICSGANCKNQNLLEDKTIIITGANSGIGRATARECARRGAKVILACRNKVKAEAVVTLIRTKTSNEKVHFIPLDLTSMTSVRDFVEAFSKQFGSAYALVNNAAYLGPKARTSDGMDQTFQVNYLGHFLLSKLLIKKTQPTKERPMRILNVTSDAYRKGALNFDDLTMEREALDPYTAYSRSKLALVLFTSELNFHYGTIGVTAVSIHPGAVQSGLLRNYPGKMGDILRLTAKLVFRTPEAGSQSIIYSLVEESLEPMVGRLVYDCRPVEMEAEGRDYRSAERLWAVSHDICRLERDDTVLVKNINGLP